jgi:hypothetical protein
MAAAVSAKSPSSGERGFGLGERGALLQREERDIRDRGQRREL